MLLLKASSMEEATKTTPAQLENQLQELVPLNIIRTETVISRLPIHNLAKKGVITINILQKNAKGEVLLQWEVSPSRNYGEPRQLAYKLDTLVINRRFDDYGRPLPPFLRLGSLRQIGTELGIPNNTATIKKALHQNAGAYITAKLTYTANDGNQRRLEAGFTRYSVIFTGERLPDGRQADAVYLIPTDPYREVLNNAPVRPLNYDYLRQLKPGAQRFYEIVSRRIFAALKYQRAEAKLPYSEYCTYSAQQRYTDYDGFKKQMYKIHRPHLASGYLKSVRFESARDAAGSADWIMYYEPGPKAKAEYQTFTRSGRVIDASPETVGAEVELPAPGSLRRRRTTTRQQYLRFDDPISEPVAKQESAKLDIIGQMTRRGISEAKARELLTSADPDLIIDQLEWGDHLVGSDPGRIKNPPGFYIHLITERVTPPEDFETSRRRRTREEARAARDKAEQEALEREDAYRRHCQEAVSQHIARNIPAADYEQLVNTRVAERRKESWIKNMPPQTVREIAERDVRLAVMHQITLPSFEEFCRTYRGREGDSGQPIEIA